MIAVDSFHVTWLNIQTLWLTEMYLKNNLCRVLQYSVTCTLIGQVQVLAKTRHEHFFNGGKNEHVQHPHTKCKVMLKFLWKTHYTCFLCNAFKKKQYEWIFVMVKYWHVFVLWLDISNRICDFVDNIYLFVEWQFTLLLTNWIVSPWEFH